MFQSSVKWSLLANLIDPANLEKFSSQFIINTHKKKEKIFMEGRLPLGVFFVESGLVKIYKTSENGNQHIFQICNSDNVFGFHPILSGKTYPDSAETLVNSEIVFIPIVVFEDILKNNHKVTKYLLSSLSEEFTKFIDQEVFLTQKTVMQRVAIMLLELDSIFSMYSDNDFAIEMSRTDLANICNTSKESLVRVLTEFKKDGVINSDGRSTKVIKHEFLKRIGYY